MGNVETLMALTDVQRCAVLGWLGGLLEYRIATQADLDAAIAYAKSTEVST